jgi:[acyl-carrier-protein] S-malonyltransferase
MKKKVVLLFPGQGSQYVGMDKFPRNHLGDEFVDNIWKQVNNKLGYDLRSIVTNGPLDKLTLTENTQPALVVTSYLYFQVLKKLLKDHSIDLVLGHSLGEYTALLCANTFTLNNAAYITHLRGKFMQEAVPAGKGAMFAILKCPKDLIKKACEMASTDQEQVSMANDNSLEQVVISGHAVACQKAVDWLQANVQERFRAIPLQVSAPFHSQLMKPAEEKLQPYLKQLSLQPNQYDYISNVDAVLNLKESSPGIIQEKLLQQICGTVQWVDSLKQLKPEDVIIEVGPGSVLSGLVKKTLTGANPIYLDQDNSLEQIRNLINT